MQLSVLSALARLDLDPWQEAAKLAGLPGETAVQKLASMIVAQPGIPSAHLDPGATAARLTALLPRKVGFNVNSSNRRVTANQVTNLRTGVPMYAVLILSMLLAQWITASHLTSKPAVNASAAGIGTPPLQPTGLAHAVGAAAAFPKPETHAAESKLAH